MKKRLNELTIEAALVWLACPVCHSALVDLKQGAVLCSGCARRYPIRDGLPVLLAHVARK